MFVDPPPDEIEIQSPPDTDVKLRLDDETVHLVIRYTDENKVFDIDMNGEMAQRIGEGLMDMGMEADAPDAPYRMTSDGLVRNDR